MILNIWMVCAAVCAVVYGLRFCWAEGASWSRSAIKTSAMALLAVAGAVLGGPVLVVLGLGLGALGDYFLSRPGRAMFLAGMAAFALGHLAYALYFVGLTNFIDSAYPSAFFGPMAVALVLLAATTEVWLAPHTGALRWPVRGYVVVITLMGLAGLAQAAPIILVGVGLFILSDLLLALLLFVMPTARFAWVLAITLWTAYWLGQLLILQGALGAVSAG